MALRLTLYRFGGEAVSCSCHWFVKSRQFRYHGPDFAGLIDSDFLSGCRCSLDLQQQIRAPDMKTRNQLIVASLALLFLGILCAGWLKWRGLRATSTPSTFETVAARSVRDFAIPATERHKANPEANDSLSIQQGREDGGGVELGETHEIDR